MAYIYLLSMLNDELGFKVFILAHIPLFTLFFIGLNQANNAHLIKGLNIFFIIHLGLHLLFLFNKRNEFKDWLSWTIISGATLFGLMNLIKMGIFI